MTVLWRPDCRACGGRWSKFREDWLHRTGCPREGDEHADLYMPPLERQVNLPKKQSVSVGHRWTHDPAKCPVCAEAADRDDYTGETE